MIEGWVDQHGPCYPHVDIREIYARIVSLAHEHAFDEVPTEGEVRERWLLAHSRWQGIRRAVAHVDLRDKDGGSARQYSPRSTSTAGRGASGASPEPE